jgi:hypothetical protein
MSPASAPTAADTVILGYVVLMLLYGLWLLYIGIAAAIRGEDSHELEMVENWIPSWIAAGCYVVAWLIGRRREPAQNAGASRPSQRTSNADAGGSMS